MQFANAEKGHVKAVRVCSFVLAMLIMCSMLFVGNVVDFEASAATYAGKTIYIDTSECSDYWNSSSFTVVAWNNGTSNVAQCVTWESTTLCKFTFPAGSGNWFTLMRWNPNKTNKSDYTGKTGSVVTWDIGSGDDALCWNRASEKNSDNISIDNSNGTYKIYIKKDKNKGNEDWKTAEWSTSTDPVDGAGEKGDYVYVDLSDVSGAFKGELQAYLWDGDLDRSIFTSLQKVSGDLYRFTLPESKVGKVIIVQMNSYSGTSSTTEWSKNWNNQTEDFVFSDYDANSSNTIKVIKSGSDYICSWNGVSTGAPTGKTYGDTTESAITLGYGTNGTTEDGHTVYSYTDTAGTTTKLMPVSAVFYDYMTDYELSNGWRTNETYTTPRSFRNKVPFKTFNSYISNIADGYSEWKYPLYFGNFLYRNNDGANGNPKWLDRSIMYGLLNFNVTWDGQDKDYLGGKYLSKFSFYANDSNPVAAVNNNNYSGSVAGLSGSTLNSSDQLMIPKGDGTSTSYLMPYFSDQTVNDGFANKIVTQFPLRVESKTTRDSVGYTSYEFNSGYYNESGTGDGYSTNDNVYFTYDANGAPNAIYYGKGSNFHVYDAKAAIGGYDNGATDLKDAKNTDNSKYGNDERSLDHPGFFPFDNHSNTDNLATDFGFGMRLDIQFQLTEDGKIAQLVDDTVKKSNESMKFQFEGDDDVWVFIDGQLVLDMGGDHGNARGSIEFASGKAIVETGVVKLASNPTIGQSEYDASNSFKANNYSNYEKKFLLPKGMTVSGDTVSYDSSVDHVMTIFYMERGSVESNLKMTFSVSPLPTVKTNPNLLSLDQEVDVSSVDQKYRSLVENYIKANEKFNFTFAENTSASSSESSDAVDVSEHQYSTNGNSTTTALGSSGTIGKQNYTDAYSFDNQFKSGNYVKVTESFGTASYTNEYTYSTDYTVTDKYLNSTVETGSTVTTSKSNTNGFKFATSSSDSSAMDNFHVHYLNKVKVGSVTVEKTYATDSSKQFNFTGQVTLPGISTPVDLGSFVVSVESPKTFTGIPIGSKVVITENETGYTTTYTIGSDESSGTVATIEELNDNTTVTFANVDPEPDSITVDLPIIKTLDGVEIQQANLFGFGLYTSENSDSPEKQIYTLDDNRTKFEIEFTTTGTYTYYIKEIAQSDTSYNYDNTIYKVVYVVGKNGNNLNVTSTTITKKVNDSYQAYTGTITFANTTKPGSIVFTKKDSNGDAVKGAKFDLYKADDIDTGAGTVKSGAQRVNTSDVVSDNNGKVEFKNVKPGDYFIIETYAPGGVELYGKPIGEYIGVSGVSNTTPITVSANTEYGGIGYVITDPKSTQLPQTGGIGVVVLIVAGVAMIALGIYLLKPSKKKDEVSNEAKSE